MSQFPGTKEIAEGNIVLDCCLLESNGGGTLHRFFLQEFSDVPTKRILTLREFKKIAPSVLFCLLQSQKKVTKMNGLMYSDQHQSTTTHVNRITLDL